MSAEVWSDQSAIDALRSLLTRTMLHDDLLSDLTPSTRYRTPAEIRAIPNDQWERWLRGNSLPWTAFYPTFECQECLRTIVNATLRRMDAQR